MDVPDGVASYAWTAACSVAAPAVLGFGVVRWLGLGPEQGLRRALGLGYVVGHYLLAHGTAAWLLLQRPCPGFVLPVAAVLLGLWLWRRSAPAPASPTASPPAAVPHWSHLPCIAVIAWLLEAFTAANVEPLRYGDDATIWTAKAKALFGAHEFELRHSLAYFVDHADYPLLNPLAQVLAFASAGRVLHWENRLPIQFFAVALVLLLSAALSRLARPWLAGLVLLVFASTSFATYAPSALADLQLACCTLAAVDALLRWLADRRGTDLALGSIAIAAMLQTKNEGALLALCVAAPVIAIAVAEWRRPRTGLAAAQAGWLLVPLSAWAAHRGFNAWFGLANDLTDPALAHGRGLFTRMVEQLPTFGGPVLRYYGGMLVDANLHRWLPLACLLGGPIAIALQREAEARRALVVTTAVVALATAGYMAVFVGTTAAVVGWHLDTAADRLMLHVLPLAAIGVAVAATPARPAAT